MKDYLKQEVDKIIEYGYKDKYFLNNGKFKKGINSFNQYVERKLLKSGLFKEFRKDMKKYIKQVNKEIEKVYKNNDLDIDEIVDLEEKADEKIKNYRDDIKKKVHNKIDNLSNQDIIDLGYRVEVEEDNDDNICPKCGGTGYIPQYSNVDNGICWECGGSGRIEEK